MWKALEPKNHRTREPQKGKRMTYKDLKVWQKAMDLVDAVYDLADVFPRSELYALSDQIRRAVVSIPSNIAEGYKRGTDNELMHFLTIANGSCAEVETQIYIAARRKMVSEEAAQKALSLCEDVGKMISAFYGKLKSKS